MADPFAPVRLRARSPELLDRLTEDRTWPKGVFQRGPTSHRGRERLVARTMSSATDSRSEGGTRGLQYLRLLPTSRFSGPLIIILVTLVVWLGSFTSVLQLGDRAVYDRFLRVAQSFREHRPNVLLVNLGDEPGNIPTEELLTALELLDELGARVVVLLDLDHETVLALDGLSLPHSRVVIGRELGRDRTDPSIPHLAWAHAEQEGVAFGVAALPQPETGVYRHQLATLEIDGRTYPTVESAAARAFGQEAERGSVPLAPFLLNFSGGSGSLPTVEIKRLLSRGLVTELVEDRIVILGAVESDPTAGLYTASHTDGPLMTELEYRGYAVDTLASRRTISESPPLLNLFLIFLMVSVSSIGYHRLPPALSDWITPIMLTACLVSGLAFLTLFWIWLPTSNFIIAILLVYFLVARSRLGHRDHALRQLLQSGAVKMRDRLWPQNFYVSQDPWPQIANMINETLGLERVVFLERIKGEGLLREIHALDGELSAIHERRRTFTRPPYVTAVQENRPIEVSDFFSSPSSSETQYLVPLSFAGQVLGFWALAVDRKQAAFHEDFAAVLMRFGEQLGELLHHRAIVREESDRPGLLTNAFRIGELNLYRRVGMVLSLMKRRLDRVDSLLRGMRTPTMVYDIFGRVRESNPEMLEILTEEKLVPYEMTALDTVMALTGEPATKVRKYLRHVILNQGSISLRVRLASRQGSKFLLVLRPLVDEGKPDEFSEPAPFGVFGFGLELVNMTAVEQLTEMKATLSQRLGIQVRNNLASIQMSSSLLGRKEAPEDVRQEAIRLLDSKVQSTVEILGECQDYLALDVDDSSPQGGCPLNLQPVLSDVLSELGSELKARRIVVNVDEPALMNQVFAEEEQLRILLRSIFAYLTRDASDDTSIQVAIEEAEKHTTFRVSNQGYGIPGEDLNRFLSGDGESGGDDSRGLRDGMRWVRQWGGSFEADSHVGEGTKFVFTLRRFL